MVRILDWWSWSSTEEGEDKGDRLTPVGLPLGLSKCRVSLYGKQHGRDKNLAEMDDWVAGLWVRKV